MAVGTRPGLALESGLCGATQAPLPLPSSFLLLLFGLTPAEHQSQRGSQTLQDSRSQRGLLLATLVSESIEGLQGRPELVGTLSLPVLSARTLWHISAETWLINHLLLHLLRAGLC